ncbi:MAG: hypothetical protein DSZ00_03090, partial [Gammaproteobacteria bacterium]
MDELAEGEPRGFSLAGELPLELILLRRGGQVLAYRNRCPHTGINLEWLPDQFLDHSGRYLKRVFDLVKDFGTSKSPKSTRSSTTHWCPGRPGHPA